MSNDQILILINAALVAVLGAMIRMWINDLKSTINKINARLDNVDAEKVDVKICKVLHDHISNKVHSHGEHGAAGEVVK